MMHGDKCQKCKRNKGTLYNRRGLFVCFACADADQRADKRLQAMHVVLDVDVYDRLLAGPGKAVE